MENKVRAIPNIGNVGEVSDFHDSSLVAFQYFPIQDCLVVVLSTPNENDVQELWQIRLYGVLEIEFETLGEGDPPEPQVAPEIYDVYDDPSNMVAKRWTKRLEELSLNHLEIHVITFASSFFRGWGENNDLEGIRVICRDFSVEQASGNYNEQGKCYPRYRIEAGEELKDEKRDTHNHR